MCPCKNIYKNIHIIVIHNSQKVETNHMSVNHLTDKQKVRYILRWTWKLGRNQGKGLSIRWQYYTMRFLGQHLDRLYGCQCSTQQETCHGSAQGYQSERKKGKRIPSTEGNWREDICFLTYISVA